MRRRRLQQGLTLLEFTLAVLIVAVLVLLAFERIAAVRGDMERARVQQTVAAMRSALALEFADRVVNGRLDQLQRQDGANALELLAPSPSRYRGEREQVTDAVEPGSWYYARDPGVVVYRPRYPIAFDGNAERLYWRVVAVRDSDGEATYDGAGRGDGMALVRSTAAGQPLPRNHEQQAESPP